MKLGSQDEKKRMKFMKSFGLLNNITLSLRIGIMNVVIVLVGSGIPYPFNQPGNKDGTKNS